MSPRSQTENEAIKESRRQQIILTAAPIFARHGLAATRMQDIAQASGISLGLAYHYFASKEELFTAIVEVAIASSLQVYRAAAATPGSGLDKLGVLLNMIFPHAFGGEGAAFFHIMIQVMTMESVPQAARTALESHWSLYNAELGSIFQAGIADGSLRQGPVDQFVMMLNSLIQGASVLSFFGQSKVGSVPKAESVLKIFLP